MAARKSKSSRKKAKTKSFKLGTSKVTPAPGYLVIKPAQAATKTASGIYLPETAEEKPQKGTVVAAGGDYVTDQGAVIKAPAKVGDEVIYKKWGGNEVKLDEVEYLFSKFEDILAIVG